MMPSRKNRPERVEARRLRALERQSDTPYPSTITAPAPSKPVSERFAGWLDEQPPIIKTVTIAPIALFYTVVGLLYVFAAPLTFALCVIDTWSWKIPVFWRLVVICTVDAFLAGLWPGTWLYWLIASAWGHETPLRLIF
jgi:hypothetical protein